MTNVVPGKLCIEPVNQILALWQWKDLVETINEYDSLSAEQELLDGRFIQARTLPNEMRQGCVLFRHPRSKVEAERNAALGVVRHKQESTGQVPGDLTEKRRLA